MPSSFYNSVEWEEAKTRVLLRDGFRCSVGRLLGGACASDDRPLHVHHIVPVSEGGAAYDEDNLGTACETHHPVWEAFRRRLVETRDRERVRCGHRHVHRLARELCEARLNREAAA